MIILGVGFVVALENGRMSFTELFYIEQSPFLAERPHPLPQVVLYLIRCRRPLHVIRYCIRFCHGCFTTEIVICDGYSRE